jgi:uncharacterized membrane protein YphA (DoxX/SURF4 family)
VHRRRLQFHPLSLITGLIVAALLLITRFTVTTIFIRAGIVKLAGLQEFRLAIANYRVVPPNLIPAVAVGVAAGETAGGVLLLLGIAPVIASAVLAGLLMCFSAAIGLNLARGRVFDCGCGGSTVPQQISWRHVAVNVVLAALAAGVAIAPPADLELLPGPRGVFSAELPAGSGIPLLLATALCLLTARMLAAALATRSR